MDNNGLRMIANPHLLKKSSGKSQESIQLDGITINHYLYLYLEKNYVNTYIPPIVFYDIINVINKRIDKFIIANTLKEIIDVVIIKFDNEINI